MKNQIIFAVGGIILVVLGILLFGFAGKPAAPEVGSDGKISGSYALEGIMRLGKPYICAFEKTDGTSQVMGSLHTDGKSVYSEMRIQSNLIEEQFNTFLLMKNGESYIWTSIPGLQNVGYKFFTAKSATKNASPAEQAQIIGTRDEIGYECEPWITPDSSVFEVPSWINFSELNR